MSTISVSNLTKHYQVHKKDPGITGSIQAIFNRKYETVKAIDDISFEIKEGELVGFIGPNGAGKTTTLKCLSGLLYPTKGKISVLGHTPFKREHVFLKQIALVMGQKNQLMWDLPPLDTFHLNKEIYEIPDTRFNEVLGDLSILLDIQDVLKVQTKKLSLGQRMKCELIASLLHSPKVLFLDEPTIGLDVVMQKKLREFIRAYNQKYKATILLTSHYMADVEELCKRIIIINHGSILYDGLLSDLVKKHAPYKTITTIFKDYADPKKIGELGDIKSFTFPELILHVPAERANKIAAKILDSFNVEDINIEEPGIEDVIRDVFMKG